MYLQNSKVKHNPQRPINCPFPWQDKASPFPPAYLYKIHFNSILLHIIPAGFPTKKLNTFSSPYTYLVPCSSHPRKGGISHENYVTVSATSLSNMSHTRCPTLVNEVMEFILFALSYAKPEIRAEIQKCVTPK